MHALKTRLKIFLILFLVLVVAGTFGFMWIEGRSIVDAAYYVIVTVATVGYGDIAPVTTAGKVFAVFLIITGVGTFLGVVANFTEIMLAKREVENRMEKLNMVIGAFYSELGIHLLAVTSTYDPDFEEVRVGLLVTDQWSAQGFENARKTLQSHNYRAAMDRVDLKGLEEFLVGNRAFLLRLLENPVLLEHQSFTDLLRAVFHLTEELTYRPDLTALPDSDKAHLAVDIKRCYTLLAGEWLAYMKYLKSNYPHLFSLAVRTNPFDRGASVIIK